MSPENEAERLWPWEEYGGSGSFVWAGSGGRASLPSRCCENMKPGKTGDCGRGCCDDFQCKSCGKEWRYEYPD